MSVATGERPASAADAFRNERREERGEVIRA
jgi:hypothetical protein